MLGPMVIRSAGIEADRRGPQATAASRWSGVVLFTRNFESPEQLERAQSRKSRAMARAAARILVDPTRTGGAAVSRHSRRIPSMSRLGEIWDRDVLAAVETRSRSGT